MDGDQKKKARDYAVGKARPPKATQWRKGQCGNQYPKPRKPQSDVELIDRLYRQLFTVTEAGKKVRKSGYEIIYTQLLAKESAGGSRAAKVRDRYQSFALADEGSGGVLVRYAENEFTRQFALDSQKDAAEKEAGATAPAAAETASARDASLHVSPDKAREPGDTL